MRVVVISGRSGSGKTSAVQAMEDCGYYCIDNLPAPLIHSFLELSSQSFEEIQKLALVVDARNRTYLVHLPEVLNQLTAEGHSFELVFLDASDEVLARRFSETRRKHPLSPEGSVLEGIQKEKELLEPVRKMATHTYDTSAMRTADLRRELSNRFGGSGGTQALTVQVMSFGFKYGLPLNADLVVDVRFLPNPYFREELKRKDGTDADVIKFVKAQGDTKKFLKEYESLLRFLIPRFDHEGKSYLTLAVGCTGGKHRSVVIVKELANFIESLGVTAKIVHRDLGRE